MTDPILQELLAEFEAIFETKTEHQGITMTFARFPEQQELRDLIVSAVHRTREAVLEEKALEIEASIDERDFTDKKWPPETQPETDGFNTGLRHAAALLRKERNQ